MGAAMRIGVVGAGHAGVEAAAAAAAAGASVTLFSGESVLPYFRPRLVALAFGQVGGDAIRLHPESWYHDKGITLRLDARVTAFDAGRRSVTSRGQEQVFDGIVVATGAGPVIPGFASGAPNAAMPLWTAEHADRIRSTLKPGSSVAIIGGGAIGIEAALRAASAGFGATIIDRADGLIAGRLMPAASSALLSRLVAKGIRILVGTSIELMESLPGGHVKVTLDHGESIEASLGILCIGSRVDVDLARRAGLTTKRGIVVDGGLRTSSPHVFACGDIAEFEGAQSNTAGAALAQGRIAGANVCASLAAQAAEMLRYSAQVDVLSLKMNDVEVHLAGRPAGPDLQVQALEDSGDSSCRLLVMRGGKTLGVQMVGTSKDFRKYVESIERM